MPGIFNRRRGSTGQVNNGPVSSSAAIAATSAFLKNSPSSTSLSSAAAAAALRSQTTSPEPIANLQTKRMVRRGSQSSNGSGSIMGGPQGQRQLARRGSSGSMTERTFRSPSPGGRASPHTARPAAADAPPVPAVRPEHKKNIVKPSGTLTAGETAERAARLSAQAKDGSSNGRPGSGLSKLQIIDRESTASPVNFSRPIATPSDSPDSPPVSPTRPKTAGSWFGAPAQNDVSSRHSNNARPKSSSGVTTSSASSIENHIQSVANSAPTKKKKKASAASQQGARLAAGSLSPAPRGTAINASPSRSRSNGQTSPASKNSPSAQSAVGKSASTSSPAGSNGRDSEDNRQTSPSPSATRRPSGLLHKQPSVVMEVPEPDEATKTVHQDGPYPKIDSNTRSPQLSPRQQQTTPGQRRNSSATRNSSLSASPRLHPRPASLEVPDSLAKSAHFSSEIIDSTPGVRHNPPGRSVSPAKSALKHSPSSSIRTSSPAATFSPSNAKHQGSDTSDSMSVTSQDGIKNGKKKKAVHVSFDDGAVAAETVPESTKSGPARRSLSPGLMDDDETMRPRPALPSFGSVRASSPRPEPGMVEKVTETLPQSRTSRKGNPEGVSSDHALASILRNAHGKNQATSTNDPLPPEVTTVEGDGQLSDNSDVDEPHVAVPQSDDVTTFTGGHDQPVKREIAIIPEPIQHMEVPDIQVLPATPGFEEASHASKDQAISNIDDGHVSIPGGWNDSHDLPESEPVPDVAKPSTGPTESFGAALKALDRANGKSPVSLPADSDSDSDDSAAFSDAAEDPSEFEAFGYASMDAIVESPIPESYRRGISTASPSIASQIPESSPEIGRTADKDGGWAHTSAYWSKQKQELKRRETDQYPDETSEESETENALGIVEPVPESQPNAPKKTFLTYTTTDNAPAQTQSNSRAAVEQRAPKQVKSSMKTSMRTPAAEQAATDSHPQAMRKTMRAPNAEQAATDSHPQPMRKTMRAPTAQQPASESEPQAMKKTMRQPVRNEAKPVQQRQIQPEVQAAAPRKTTRPMSASIVEYKQAPTARQKPAKVAKTEDSDSESSFKRKRRPASMADSGRYTMKRSMRSGSVDMGREQRPASSQGVSGSGRWSVRSMSPTPSMPAKGAFRQSLRGTSIPEGPTLRGQNSIAKDKGPKNTSKFSMSGFSKSPKAGPASGGRSSTGGGFRSRFADSDSEDNEAAPATRSSTGGFRSRFADSDDEDQPKHIAADLTPVRGIPRPEKQVKEESSELDDSSDDDFSRRRRGKRDTGRSTAKPVVPSQSDIDKAMAVARQNVATMTGNQDLLEPQPAKGKMQKRGTTPITPQPVPPAPAVEASPVTRRKGLLGSIFGRRNSDVSVTSRQDTSRAGAEMSPPQSPASARGKLQRRNTPKMTRTASAISTVTANTVEEAQMTPVAETDEETNWPLTPPPKIPAAAAENARPASSDGVAESGRTKLNSPRPKTLRSQSGGHPTIAEEGPVSADQKTEKKKRFSRLRRAFGGKK
ncbi:hypothetical protein K461DRAFT_313648 [Myriangium duriaei CBS 260.36]|uniref:Uncharacterized protein n=1 Tax=Myriangium duriaei CBS 260.36 TaxID=1168546 RepID=A0A9P4J3Q8_9PEZI|nr:hypothetical protein K461DRAFT_313648 [Myriangium duriaei CBS 260.36]